MKRKGPGRGDPERMKKLKLSVQEFVERAEPSGADSRGGGAQEDRGKSRKELRKEKRKFKKIKRKQYYERRHLDTPEGQGEKNKETKEEKEMKTQPAQESKKKDVKKDINNHPTEEIKKKKQTGEQAKKKKKPTKEEKRKQSLLEANEKEEKEIKRLEKSLKMNKRRNKKSLPQAFTQDGLDYILGVLDAGSLVSGLYDEEDEQADTAQKLHKLSEKMDEGSEEEGQQSDMGEGSEKEDEQSDMEEGGGQGDMEEGEGSEEDDQEFEEDNDLKEESEDKFEEGEQIEEESGEETAEEFLDSQEKTTHSPANKSMHSTGSKYIPPQLRQSSEAVDAKKREELERLKKSVKGLMNRLSEPNMPSISGQLEELYMTNSRKDMSDTVTSVILDACITSSRMPDRLMMEHVLLVSILHHSVGIEVGAHILEFVVKKFDTLYQNNSDSKECDNLLIFIGHLYNFHVIECSLVFDILKKFVTTFTERDIELVLLLLKNVGFSLRKDDALALKELISDVQTKASDAGKKFQDQTRIRFMLETMMALKNNDMRKIPGYDPEPVEKLRKLQRSLVHNSTSGSDTRLRVSLDNLLDADQVGRWWIVGSSWSGAPMIDSSTAKTGQLPIGKVSAKIMDLARKQRMNTDIRRNIFCVLMTSEDFLDAFEKLLKLGLKDHQEREIVHVLLDCCLQEKVYNPFYAFLSGKFCEYDRRFQMTFQFSMWDKFRDLGSLSPTTFTNLINLLSHLLKSKSLALSVFKVIEFSELDKTKVSFLRQVLYKLLMDTDIDDLPPIFEKIAENPKLGMLREGLKLFITHFLLRNIRAQKSEEEADLLIQRADLAVKALQAKENRLRL